MGLSKRRKKRNDFERVALPHIDSMYGTALRLTRNPSDAEDLVQEATLRAYRFWDTFEQESNCRAWLLKIVTNTFLNQYQKRKRSREILQAARDEQSSRDGVLFHEQRIAQRGPEALLLERSFSDEVQEALASLPDDFRIAIVLCDVQGLSYKEIAEIMELPGRHCDEPSLPRAQTPQGGARRLRRRFGNRSRLQLCF